MANYKGSGRFVAISANTSGYNNVYTTGMHGISFGKDQQIYCSIASHYYESYGYIYGATLSIESGLNSAKSALLPLCISFPNIKRLTVNGKVGYTGSFTVAKDVGFNSNYVSYQVNSGYYKFTNGLLTQLG